HTDLRHHHDNRLIVRRKRSDNLHSEEVIRVERTNLNLVHDPHDRSNRERQTGTNGVNRHDIRTSACGNSRSLHRNHNVWLVRMLEQQNCTFRNVSHGIDHRIRLTRNRIRLNRQALTSGSYLSSQTTAKPLYDSVLQPKSIHKVTSAKLIALKRAGHVHV